MNAKRRHRRRRRREQRLIKLAKQAHAFAAMVQKVRDDLEAIRARFAWMRQRSHDDQKDPPQP